MSIQFIARWLGSDSDKAQSGYSEPGWYFWDECGCYCYGPFSTREEASAAQNVYAEGL